MLKNGYMLSYKDDNNKKYITFVKEESQIPFYKNRFGENNVTIQPCILPEERKENK